MTGEVQRTVDLLLLAQGVGMICTVPVKLSGISVRKWESLMTGAT